MAKPKVTRFGHAKLAAAKGRIKYYSNAVRCHYCRRGAVSTWCVEHPEAKDRMYHQHHCQECLPKDLLVAITLTGDTEPNA